MLVTYRQETSNFLAVNAHDVLPVPSPDQFAYFEVKKEQEYEV